MIWILNFNAKSGCIDNSKRSFSEKLKFFAFLSASSRFPFQTNFFQKIQKIP
ncbi:hypothetical protein D036_0390 [Vibrio parahaemolyticus VP232]|nr:hypothetical protein D036_0390 [Vibrio parahaemolyticus VP232]